MLERLRPLSLAALALIPVPAYAGEGSAWFADYDAAVKVAKAEGKDLLVDFTGSDWCGWCKRLSAEVFDKPEFLEAVKKDYVLVALDYPRFEPAKSRVPNPARNAELSRAHAIEGFPTVVLMTSDGDAWGRMQYQPGGPAAFLEQISKLRSKGRAQLAEAIELAKAFETAADDAAREAAWTRAVEAMEKMDWESIGSERLVPVVRVAISRDADNAKGQKQRALKALFGVRRFQEGDLRAARALDSKNELGLFESSVLAELQAVDDNPKATAAMAAVEAFDALGAFKDREVAIKIYFTAADWNHRIFNQPEKAKKYAAKAKEAGAHLRRMVETLDEILGS